MAEELIIKKGTREERYVELIPQIAALMEGEPDLIANLANVCAALRNNSGGCGLASILVKGRRTGVRSVSGSHRLHTNPKRERRMWGGMGTNENNYCSGCECVPRAYYCSRLSESELFSPVRHNEVVAVLDVDHSLYASFDKTD